MNDRTIKRINNKIKKLTKSYDKVFTFEVTKSHSKVLLSMYENWYIVDCSYIISVREVGEVLRLWCKYYIK